MDQDSGMTFHAEGRELDLEYAIEIITHNECTVAFHIGRGSAIVIVIDAGGRYVSKRASDSSAFDACVKVLESPEWIKWLADKAEFEAAFRRMGDATP